MNAALALSSPGAIALGVSLSLLVVGAVLWGMWRLPVSEKLLGWGPLLALLSPWAGLASCLATAALWFLPAPDLFLPAVFLALHPLALGSGVLVLWLYRGMGSGEETIRLQRTQAWVGIVLGLAAVAMGYVFVMVHKAPLTPVGV